MVELRPITEGNFLDAFNLALAPGQERFVSHPIRSLAQAYVYRDHCQPFGIYAQDTMVGYVLVIYDRDETEYNVWHMMIDASRQGQGFGRYGLSLVIEYIRTRPLGDARCVSLTCNRENAAALHLYERAGFAPTGVEDDGEIEMRMVLGA